MDGLEKALGDLARLTDRWMRATSLAAHGLALETGPESAPASARAPAPPRLVEVTEFGDNPGSLRLFQYRPAELAADPALVVVLHGCTQTAAAYDAGSGWSTEADRDGFVLLYPEQQSGNNPKTCFNWYSRRDTAPGRGEAGSIRAMIAWAMKTHGIAPGRVFITGLSAGAAMAVAMMALYPDLFSAGAVIAGMPFRAATTVSSALLAMFEGRERTAREWGDLVRAACDHEGPWPRISIWQGDADSVVVPVNAGELLKQWLDVHGLDPAAGHAGPVEGHPRRVWNGADGRPVVESWTIAGMGHGTPVDSHHPGGGVPGPFMLDAGISSTAHIAEFFGLAPLRAGREADPVLPVLPAEGGPPPVVPLPGGVRLPPAFPQLPGLPGLPLALRGGETVPPPARTPEPVPVITAIEPPAVIAVEPSVVAGEAVPAGAGPHPVEEPPVRVVGPEGDWVTPVPSIGETPLLPVAPLPGMLARLRAGIGRRARGVGTWARDVAGRMGWPGG